MFFFSKVKGKKKIIIIYDDLKVISSIFTFPILPVSRVASCCGLDINHATVCNVLRKGHHYSNCHFSTHHNSCHAIVNRISGSGSDGKDSKQYSISRLNMKIVTIS